MNLSMDAPAPPAVRTLNVSRIPLPPPPHPPPGETVALSLFDAFWIIVPPIQRLFLYPDAAPLTLSTLAGRIRHALGRILPDFHPFAGELTYLSASGDLVVDCSPSCFDGAGPGVALVEAESDADVRRLARDDAHDLDVFPQLVPSIRTDELPAAVSAIQVTTFYGGGVAVGITVQHTVTDGKGLWQFVEALATACWESAPAERSAVPSHDRTVIKVLGGDEIARVGLRRLTPALPRIRSPADPSTAARLRLHRRTFTIDSTAIQNLRQRIALATSTAPKPSTFVSLAALAWTSIAKAEAGIHHDNSGDRPIALIFLADCRSRVDPPVPNTFIGNFVRLCTAIATESELAGVGGLTRACAAVQRAVREQAEEPLDGCARWIDDYLALVARTRTVYVVGSPTFGAYEADFGWGRAGRVELVSMNHDGEVVLVGGRDEGSVQVSVSLSADHMEDFARAFVEHLVGFAGWTFMKVMF